MRTWRSTLSHRAFNNLPETNHRRSRRGSSSDVLFTLRPVFLAAVAQLSVKLYVGTYNLRMKAALFLAVLTVASVANAQGTFRNLDFESANVASLPPGQGELVNLADGLPGWSADVVNAQGMIFHNNTSLGGPVIAIEGPDFDPMSILAGSFTAYLGGEFGRPNPTGTASIWQTGQIPATAKSLFFLAAPTIISPPFQVTVGGVVIPVTETSSTSKYGIWAGDISAFAGQTEQLMFTALPAHGGFLDQITFSSNAIPEPTTGALVCLSGLVIGLRKLRHKT